MNITEALELADKLGFPVPDDKVKELEDFASMVAAKERERCWEEINNAIDKGKLPGNGTDKTAERNGLILATNIIHGLGKRS